MLDLTLYEKANHRRLIAMDEGGAKLGQIRKKLFSEITPGLSFEKIENRAQQLISESGATPSFSTVPGYHWATCVMVNDALCHGIPKGKLVSDGDILTIDVGLIWKGYHVDSTGTIAVGAVSSKVQSFLDLGRRALDAAIALARPGASVYELSLAMQETVRDRGGDVVSQLTGHGIGEQLHMPPNIPCRATATDKKVLLRVGQTIAVEVMYTQGSPQLVIDADGWTYRTADGSLSGMFEDTLVVGPNGPHILTEPRASDII